MPNTANAKKSLRQNLRNRERNRAEKSSLKSQIRKVLSALSLGNADLAKAELKGVAKRADRAAAARTIHPNRAARIKSRLSARIVALKGSNPESRSTKKVEKKSSSENRT